MRATMNNHKTNLHGSEQGIALIVSLLLMTTLSLIGASLMFLAQTETASSISYRLMSQARYGAESGVHKAINYLHDPVNGYALPGSVTDPLASYDLTVSPVTFNNKPVVLSSNPLVASNYPVAAVQTAFNAAVQGTLAAAGTNVAYTASAKLLSMIPITTYAGVTTVVQTWQITADGAIGGVHSATVEVMSTLEQQIVPALSNAAFATGGGCGALSFGGNEVINSYDSSNMTLVGGVPVTQASGGNVGTNGNMTLTGQATIDGTLSTPKTGVGACVNGQADALTESLQASVAGGLVKLPQTVVLDPPLAPNPTPPTTSIDFTKNSGCAGASSCAYTTVSSKDIATLTGGTQAAPLVLGDVQVSTSGTLHLTAGYYNFNSISVGSQSSIVVDSGPIIVNIAGLNQSTPIDFSSGGVINATVNPALLQVVYAGTGNIKLTGGAQNAMVIYAPNATANFPASNSNFYGSIIAAQITANGAQIHYDRHLATKFFTSGNLMLTSFTWKKY